MTNAIRLLSAWLFAWLLMPAPAAAQPLDPAPPSAWAGTKAEYLYRALRFVTWPREAFRNRFEPISIGVLGDPEFAAFLRGHVAQREVAGRGLLVRPMKEGEPLNGLHVLYVGESQRERLRAVIGAVNGPVFIVTEWKGALEQGSALNFLVADRRVVFEVNPAAARERSLELSAQLLQPAARVLEAPPSAP